MMVDGKQMRPIWFDPAAQMVKAIDQRKLPHEFVVMDLDSVDRVIYAIQTMVVRGAPLIGVTGAYGVYVAAKTVSADAFDAECLRIKQARPTAVNLAWGVDRVTSAVAGEASREEKINTALLEAGKIAEYEAENCEQIGIHGLPLIQDLARKKNGAPVNLLTHCNAGWLACVEYGTATAPMYKAHEAGIPIHVWVDETRPLNQGARLTAWELGKAGIPHTVVADNTGGHLMQQGMVDMVITGTDRTTWTGDVANKIGTYLKALAAKDNDIPFYVALPSTTFDWEMTDGIKQIPIENRDPDEVTHVLGYADGVVHRVRLTPKDSPAANFAFDVTPARLVTGFITERGVCRADGKDVRRLFPEK
jgi:methylthioribose-1-phosphate isomerase